ISSGLIAFPASGYIDEGKRDRAPERCATDPRVPGPANRPLSCRRESAVSACFRCGSGPNSTFCENCNSAAAEERGFLGASNPPQKRGAERHHVAKPPYDGSRPRSRKREES
ncbi:hypothetical protein Z043_118662, partial [Scleropages formosus]